MKKVRIVLSITAMVFAVGAALATSSKNEDMAISVSYAVGNCNVAGSCSQIGDAQCENTETHALLYERPNLSTCNTIAKGTFTPNP
jgi:hypothetical protein